MRCSIQFFIKQYKKNILIQWITKPLIKRLGYFLSNLLIGCFYGT